MNARNYRVSLNLSQLDFPPINGLGRSSDFTQTEPPVIVNNKVVLKITKALILTDVDTNKEHEVFNAQSVYEIPVREIKTRDDIYDFYKDATLCLNEAYQFAQRQLPGLPNLSIPYQPIETYEREIGGVLYLLDRLN